jgi:hypothetical protein
MRGARRGGGPALEQELEDLQRQLAAADRKVAGLMEQVEEKMPLYKEARAALGPARADGAQDCKKHLVFEGVELDAVRVRLARDPAYQADILEARLRAVMFHQLNITRDIPLERVSRLEGSEESRPTIVASFAHQADKWEVLCLARLQRGAVTITEDLPARGGSRAGQADA